MGTETTIKDKFKRLWKYYLLQSSLAATALFILVIILGKEKMVIISAMGATAMTEAATLKPNNSLTAPSEARSFCSST